MRRILLLAIVLLLTACQSITATAPAATATGTVGAQHAVPTSTALAPTPTPLPPSPTPTPVVTASAVPSPTPTPAPTLPVTLPSTDALAEQSGFLLFSVNSRRDGVYVPLGVYLYAVQSGQLTQISGEGSALQAVSPDRRSLLISQGSLLYRVPLDGSAQTLLTDRLFPHSPVSAAMMLADGRVALIAAHEEESYALWLLSPAGDAWQRLSPPGSPQPISLFQQPDAEQIIWQSGECAENGICTEGAVFTSALDGSLSQDYAGVTLPAFSPAGDFFAYRYFNSEDRLELAIAPLDRTFTWNLSRPGDPVTNFSHPQPHISDYAWSPDGTQLAALYLERSDYSGKLCCQRLFLANPSTLGKLELPRSEGLHARIAWSPDGKRLALTATQKSTGGYHLIIHLLNLTGYEMTRLEGAIELPGADYRYVTSLYWIQP